MKSLLILGAGGHAKVLAETALACNPDLNLAFLDDRISVDNHNAKLLNYPILGSFSLCRESTISAKYSSAIVAVGNCTDRLAWLSTLKSFGYELPSIIHPTAWVSPTAEIGLGSVVCAHAVVQSSVLVGIGNIINTACSVDHDTQLEDGVHICPHAALAGHVYVGLRSWIGIGATVIQHIKIGSDVIVGASSAVVNNIPDQVTVCGVPARILNK